MRLIGVTKGVPVERIAHALSLGLVELGENRIQEARPKMAALQGRGARWHLIGHLQRNKAKDAVELFDVIHSVDSWILAQDVDRRATQRNRVIDVLLQVNVSGEATKFGCAPDETAVLAQQMIQLQHLRLVGLMTLTPFSDDPESARPHFRRLRQLRDHLAHSLGLESRVLSLSMGMSQDFEVAIEEGADLVRIGTAIFGARS